MNFLEKLDLMMNIKGLNKNTLSKSCDIPYTTIDNWYKRGYEGLKLTTLRKLADFFETSLDYWVVDNITDYDYGKTSGFKINFDEMEHIKKYRDTDERGQKAVDYILELEYDRTQQLKNKSEIKEAGEPYAGKVTVLPTLMQHICAGTGSFGDDVQFEDNEYPSIKVPDGAEYAAVITGNSMEPDFFDGDVVFYKSVTTLELGEIGIFNINDENVIKIRGKDGLEAINPDYDDIHPSEDDHVVIIGKVLGKL